MAHQHYLYFKLLLRNNLLLDIDEYELVDTKLQGLVCNFMGMRLASAFQPVLRADGRVVGREALLRAEHAEHGDLLPQHESKQKSVRPEHVEGFEAVHVSTGSTRTASCAIDPDVAFEKTVKIIRVVQFDRLVRIIHLVNHARNFAEHELLFLNVHPRLVNSVNDHGRTFERILHYYSVPTSRVVIEIKEAGNVDEAILADAVSNYRSLGYRIAVDNFGTAHSSLERVLELQPDIVKLDGALVQSTEHSRSATTSFKKLVDRFHSAAIQVAVEGIETARQLETARKAGADLLQGYHLARPEFTAATWRQLGRSEHQAAWNSSLLPGRNIRFIWSVDGPCFCT